MTAPTLPRSFVPVDGYPLYFVTADGCESPFAWGEPTLPAVAGAHWSDPAEITADHTDLTTSCLPELLFVADFDPNSFAEDQAIAAAITAVDRALVIYGCDLTRCASECSGRLAKAWESSARWSRCVSFAARLAKVEA